MQEFFRQDADNAEILARIVALLESKIPIQRLIQEANEKSAVSEILSDLVQTGLRKEVDRLKECLSLSRQVRMLRFFDYSCIFFQVVLRGFPSGLV